MTAAVVVSGVLKRFGTTTALDGVSCEIQAGELFGFIGPDGAGKTTLFRILATLLVPDRGTATVLGQDVVRGMWPLRSRIGYMAGRFSLYGDLSVEENLRFFASVFGTTLEQERDRIAPIYSQLEPFRDRRAAALSGGMKQKLALCCALVHRPELLLLDEPTTGVDAVSRREFWDLPIDATGSRSFRTANCWPSTHPTRSLNRSTARCSAFARPGIIKSFKRFANTATPTACIRLARACITPMRVNMRRPTRLPASCTRSSSRKAFAMRRLPR